MLFDCGILKEICQENKKGKSQEKLMYNCWWNFFNNRKDNIPFYRRAS